jgi:hypothetical protein
MFISQQHPPGDIVGTQQLFFEVLSSLSLKVGMLSSEWKASQATPCGSCVQYLSERA